MSLKVTLRKMLHRKAPEYCAPFRAGNTATGSFIVSDKANIIPGADCAYAVAGVSSIWNYNAAEDAWIQIKNSGASGTFGAGACGEFRSLSAPAGATSATATAGTTTTITTSLTITRSLEGYRIRVIGGTGVGYVGEILSNTLGANAVLTVAVASSEAFSATTQFQIFGGSLWFFCPGTGTVGFSVYDRITDTWTSRSASGIATTFGTDGQLVSTPSSSSNCCGMIYDSGTATAATSTTLTDSSKTFPVSKYCSFFAVKITGGTGKGQLRTIKDNSATQLTLSTAWDVTPDATSTYEVHGSGFEIGTCSSATSTTLVDSSKTSLPVNGFVNFQIRIYAGTGAGQIRTITASTATGTYTVAAWTVTPDTTSKYVIEGNDDFMYLIGNNAVPMYKYTWSTNTWSTVSPGTTRGGVAGAGCTADWIDGVPSWNLTTNKYGAHYSTTIIKQNGRYLYCFRCGTTNTLDVFDIAAVTWINDVTYGNKNETFTTGTCSVDFAGLIYIQKDASGVILRYDVNRNILEPCIQSVVPQGTAVVGDKMAIGCYIEDQILPYLYTAAHTSAVVVRYLLF